MLWMGTTKIKSAAVPAALALIVAGCAKTAPDAPSTSRTQSGSVKTRPDDAPDIAEANRLLTQIGRETSERYTPIFLYESPTYRKVVDDICRYKPMFFTAAKHGPLDENEFFVAWQAMEHLPIEPYIEWMTIWVEGYKAGRLDYRALRKILFPNLDENGEYYYHFNSPYLSSFYRSLKNDDAFLAMLKNDNSLAPYDTDAGTAFAGAVDDFLSGKTWAYVENEIMACQIIPSHGPRDMTCPTTTVREKERPPKWWKMKCDAAFGEVPVPDSYWSGPGSDAPWWENKQ